MDHVPFLPMEAKPVEALPEGEGWQFEPKWDGFRCLAITGAGPAHLFSRTGKPLSRYFPDVATALADLPPTILDGELIIPIGKHLSFDALQMRLHPAASRVARLAREHPALFMAFDRLDDLDLPLTERRAALEEYLSVNRSGVLRLSPLTVDRSTAQKWLARAGGALDGVIAKRRDEPYRPDKRAMLKIKNWRDADCIVGGFRLKADGGVASLLLGLYDAEGKLNHVGFTSALGALDRHALAKELHQIGGSSAFTGDSPGGPSRWNRGVEKEWFPILPTRVVEVRYDHAAGGKFRHGTTFARWRPDKRPEKCTVDQFQTEVSPAVVAQGPARDRLGRTATLGRPRIHCWGGLALDAARSPAHPASQRIPSGCQTGSFREDLMATTPTKKPNALQQPMNPSPELEAVIGKGQVTRGEMVSKVWDYIKKNNLQNPANKREILADANLKKVFGVDKCSMFEMNKHLSKHVTK